jgi:hypothetical protein
MLDGFPGKNIVDCFSKKVGDFFSRRNEESNSDEPEPARYESSTLSDSSKQASDARKQPLARLLCSKTAVRVAMLSM